MQDLSNWPQLVALREQHLLVYNTSNVANTKRFLFQVWEALYQHFEQYLELPRALCDSDEKPNKGSKCTARDYLETRYQQICSPTLCADWSVECVILGGMFAIHTSPKYCSTMKQYTIMLVLRFLYHYVQ